MSAQNVSATPGISTCTQTTCCIVGGGPAGAMLALMLARQEIQVMLLEAHADFEREFRGDTIHPSALTILDELGLAERLLQLRHTRIHELSFRTEKQRAILADFSRLKTKYPFIAVLPQARFLEFIVEEAQRYPNFQLVMNAQVDALLEEHGVVRGVRYRGKDGWHEVHALLTVGADGRFSRVRKLAGFEPIKASPPMDVLWFRLSRQSDNEEAVFGRFGNHAILAVINRFDYWQIGYVIPKGHYQQIRAAGLEHLRRAVAAIAPEFTERLNELQEWKQISVLAVEANRLSRWYRPGLLLIGDAAHVMSPVAGVGINYAIQDAVATANTLSADLKQDILPLKDLAAVQRRRELPTRVMQAAQSGIQRAILAHALQSDSNQLVAIPLPMRVMSKAPGLRALFSRLVGFGLWPVHVRQSARSSGC